MIENPKPPTISAVISSYNYGHYVCQAVDSVLSQTVAPLEIIVVDDGSTDDTRERLAAYGNRIHYVHQKNQGIGRTRNNGMTLARGQYVAFLDADDVWHPQKLEYQSRVLIQNPDAMLVGTTSYVFGHDDVGSDSRDLAVNGIDVEEVPFERLLETSVFCPSSVIAHKNCLLESGGFDTELHGVEDMCAWWKIAASRRALKLSAPLTGYRTHPGSISTRYLMMIKHQRIALKNACATLPPLCAQSHLRRLARARLYRESSLMRSENGNRWHAIVDMLISIVNRPTALHSSNGQRQSWLRAKVLLRYLLFGFHRS